MSEAEQVATLRQRYDEIAADLARAHRAGDAHEQQRLRQEVVSLLRDTDGLIRQLNALRDGLRPLVERFRAAPRDLPVEPPPVRVDHLNASTFVERGWTAIALGEYETAHRELNHALSLAPGDAHAEALLSWALARLGRADEARRLVSAILVREPDNALARTVLGYVCLREGRPAEAVDHLTGVIRAGSHRTAMLYANLYLGMVHTEWERYREAVGYFRRALEMGPNLSEAYWEMGRAFYRDGNRTLALEVWQHGARANRYNPWGERCGQAAAQLQAGEAVSVD